jgi:branched-chain amino acid transport system ATP-binding protein
MKAVAIIKAEHRNLESVLFTLGHLVKEIEKNKAVPLNVFHGIIYYLDSFLDKYHHPKENKYLFPALLERHPESRQIIEELGKQHGRGERMLLDVVKTLSAFEFLGDSGFAGFRDAVQDYIEFERTHIHLEETEILPMAKQYLSDSDWIPIEKAFLCNEDPLFGTAPSTEFQTLFHSLSSLIPAPYGLGSAISD